RHHPPDGGRAHPRPRRAPRRPAGPRPVPRPSRRRRGPTPPRRPRRPRRPLPAGRAVGGGPAGPLRRPRRRPRPRRPPPDQGRRDRRLRLGAWVTIPPVAIGGVPAETSGLGGVPRRPPPPSSGR